jgi:acyl-coenzyme A synthetase/AMP-(fatty) acid ligase
VNRLIQKLGCGIIKLWGNSKCPIVDTWWQTETGGIMIAPQTGAINLKPGSATKPFYGIKPVIVDKKVLKLKAPEKEDFALLNHGLVK